MEQGWNDRHARQIATNYCTQLLLTSKDTTLLQTASTVSFSRDLFQNIRTIKMNRLRMTMMELININLKKEIRHASHNKINQQNINYYL
jgi:hypothetical protein